MNKLGAESLPGAWGKRRCYLRLSRLARQYGPTLSILFAALLARHAPNVLRDD